MGGRHCLQAVLIPILLAFNSTLPQMILKCRRTSSAFPQSFMTACNQDQVQPALDKCMHVMSMRIMQIFRVVLTLQQCRSWRSLNAHGDVTCSLTLLPLPDHKGAQPSMPVGTAQYTHSIAVIVEEAN